MKIEKRLELKASPERVWRALTDPKELASWFPDEADVELRQGACGSFRWDKYGRYQMRVEEIDPPRRLVWSWARDPDVPLADAVVTTVEWTLTATDDGRTVVELCESGFARPKDREENEKGWNHELAELAEYLVSASVAR